MCMTTVGQHCARILVFLMYFYYFQKSRNVMFSGTVPDYLFIYVFQYFPEVQKCYVFRHCARLFVYLFIYIISRSPEMLCFQALCQIICLFMYFQKGYIFRHCARLFVYLYYFQKSRNVMFSGTVPDYLFIYVFLFFQKSRNVIVTKFVRKEGSRQGWLVKTRVNFIYR